MELEGRGIYTVITGGSPSHLCQYACECRALEVAFGEKRSVVISLSQLLAAHPQVKRLLPPSTARRVDRGVES